MFAISVDLLAGRYSATAYNDRNLTEWPPHPARLFSALIATWAEHEPESPEGAAERAALEWLEQQEPPVILACDHEHAGIRTVVPVFVPVNDASQVSEVDRETLDDAEATLAAATNDKQRTKAEKEVAKLRAKHLADTAKAIAVPAKFSKDTRAGLDVLPEHRGKQPRTFPTASPSPPTFAFVWPDAAPSEEVRRNLERLMSRLIRLGHSSSQVRASLMSEAAVGALAARVTSYRPDEHDGELVIRWVDAGQLGRLSAAFERHRETEPRVLPARFVRYTERASVSRVEMPHSPFGSDCIIFSRVDGPRLPVVSVVGLAKQFRRALMSFADQPIHSILSGHESDGKPATSTHLAVVPLPAVHGPFADGALLGLALALPRDADAEARRAVMRAVGHFESHHRDDSPEDAPALLLRLGSAGSLRLRRVEWTDGRVTLQASTWTRPSKHWVTATPIALDRNPGDLHASDPGRRAAAFEEATSSVREALTRAGLPSPTNIDVLRSCVLPGTAKPRTYPRFPSESTRTQRVLVHARLVFDRRVGGPLLLGAGRYHGLGLFVPVDGSSDAPARSR